MFSHIRKRVSKWTRCIYTKCIKVLQKNPENKRRVLYSKQRKLGDLEYDASPKSPRRPKDIKPNVCNEITPLDENAQERIIDGYKIYLDNDDVNYFDENTWRKNTNGTLTNRKTQKLLHRIILKVEDKRGNQVLFKNPCSGDFGDFRKQNLVLEKSDEVLRQEEKEREKTEHFVFVDIKSTGTPKVRYIWGNPRGYNSPRNNDNYENARLISVSYIITDGMNNTIMEPKQLYVKPNRFEIPSNITELTGITNDFVVEHGSPLQCVLKEFEEDIKKHNVSIFVSHNVYDSYIMKNSAFRPRRDRQNSLLLHLEQTMRYYCTCTYKGQTLKKSIIELLKEEPVGLHNALNDMMYCKRIFLELRQQNLIEPTKINTFRESSSKKYRLYR